MFTGIVEGTGTIVDRTRDGDAGKLRIATPLAAEMGHGDSIAVNGCCLTVEEIDTANGVLQFHTLSQTLDKTNLGHLAVGKLVNLERPLRVGDRLGGHLVMGHVDCTAPTVAFTRERDDWVMEIELPESMRALAIDKGSIAVDGISLTIADLREASFTVHLIPVTWELTNIKEAEPGKPVNLEMDMVGKYVLRREELAAAQ